MDAHPQPPTDLSRTLERLYRRFAHYLINLPSALRSDLQGGQKLIWLVIFFGHGIGLYFLLPREPPAVLLLPISLLLLVFEMWRYRQGRANAGMAVCAAILAGMSLAQLHSLAAPTSYLAKPGSYQVTGTILSVQRWADRPQLLLGDIDAEQSQIALTKLRVYLKKDHDVPGVGTRVRIYAFLLPPTPATRPGGYNPRFFDFFSGIGAGGFALEAPQIVHNVNGNSFRLRFLAAIDDIRADLRAHILDMEGQSDAAALCVALLVGDRTALSDTAREMLRQVGLAHILAISGLHMALFAGAAFFSLRWFLAAIPSLALSWRIDRIAALFALASAAFYLFLSGGSVPTQRAFVMIGLIFLARLIGRTALTLRNVALAALIILIITPEMLLSAGFQMSFAATTALIGVFRWWSSRKFFNPPRRDLSQNLAGPFIFLLSPLWKWSLGIAATALIAGLATAPFGLFHFGRIAPLGLIANLLAMPILTLLVMPSGAGALLLHPLGLDAPALRLMLFGTGQILGLASWVYHLPAPTGSIGVIPAIAVWLMTIAGLALFLLPAGYRRLAVLVFLPALILAMQQPRADIYIAPNGKSVAFRNSAGMLLTSGRRVTRAARSWLTADGVPRLEFDGRKAKTGPLFRCDSQACIIKAHGIKSRGEELESPKTLIASLVKKAGAFTDDCPRVDIIISSLPAPPDCAAPWVFDAEFLENNGATSLFLQPVALKTATIMMDGLKWQVRQTRSDKKQNRPWTR